MAWLFHLTAWVTLETKYFTAENHSFLLLEGEQVVGVQPLYLSLCGLGTWTEKLLHSGIHRHTGLALADGLTAPYRKAARAAAMGEIMMLADRLDADRIQLNAQNLAPSNVAREDDVLPFWVEGWGFHWGLNFGPNGIAPAPGLSTACADQIVDLRAPEDGLFSRLDEGCRRAVRKATSAGVLFAVGNDASAVDEYCRLTALAAERTGETAAPEGYYHEVWNQFHKTGRCSILFAQVEGRNAAALLLLLDKHSMHYLGGASDSSYLDRRVNDYLHWRAMLWGQERGQHRYRLGPYFPGLPAEWPIQRVSRFKTKFGGRSVQVIQGSHFRHPEKYLQDGISHLKLMCGPR